MTTGEVAYACFDNLAAQHGMGEMTWRAALAGPDPAELHRWGVHDAVLFDAALAKVRALEAAPGPENTLVVLLGDHLAHPTVSAQAELAQRARRNTAVVLGAGTVPGVNGSPGTMVGLYSTLLDLDELNRRVATDRALSRAIWQGPER